MWKKRRVAASGFSGILKILAGILTGIATYRSVRAGIFNILAAKLQIRPIFCSYIHTDSGLDQYRYVAADTNWYRPLF